MKVFSSMKVYSFIILYLLIAVHLFAQQTESYQLEETFLDADSWFYYEDYKEALPLFMRVFQEEPDNYNVNYKIGYCYLNIPGQKHKAIPYLERAIQNVTSRYSENTYSEKEAPLDAYFYLGNAYLINNQLDKARESYYEFEKLIGENKGLLGITREIYDTSYLNKQLITCEIAEVQFENPANFTAQNLGNPINKRFSEFNPAVSGDGKSMVYTAELQFYDAIFYSKYENGKWSFPINIMGQLGVDDLAAGTALSYDGTELYLYRNDNFDGNIYVSYLEDGIWSKVKKLNENINTKYWEPHASVSPDGTKLFFSSNREGGYGDLDLYYSEKDTSGKWGPAINLGPVINTEWNESTPVLHPNGNILFFSSEGHNSMGGYDIFYSVLRDTTWSLPENIGYPLNTTDNDLFLQPTKDGKAYYSKFSRKGFGGQDIYLYDISHLDTPTSVKVEGILAYDNRINKNEVGYTVNIIDQNTSDTLFSLDPLKDTNVHYKTPSGKNHLIYEDINPASNEQLYISQKYDVSEVYLEPIVEKKLQKELAIKTEQDTITTDKGENLKIKLTLQEGNRLIVNTLLNNEILDSVSFDINDEDFIYEFKPVKGESKIKFSLIDGEGNVISEEVSVAFLPKDQKALLKIADQTLGLNPEGKKVKIKLSVEKDSRLYVDTYLEDDLINSENFEMVSESFVYEYQPTEGNTRINFKLIDSLQNIKNEEIIISHRPIEQELAGLINNLNQYESSSMLRFLHDPSIEESQSIGELFNLLFELNTDYQIQSQQVDALILSAALSLIEDPHNFISNLKQLLDKDFQNDIDSIFKEKPIENISRFDALQMLFNGLLTRGYSEDEIYFALGLYVDSLGISSSEMLNKFIELTEISPSFILGNLDEDAMNITSTEELIRYLQSKELFRDTMLNNLFTLLNGYIIASSAQKELDKLDQQSQATTESIKKSENSTLLILIVVITFIVSVLIILYFNRKNK